MESDTIRSARAKITKAQNLVHSITQMLAICAVKKRAHLLVERTAALTRLETAQKHLDDLLSTEATRVAKLAEQQRLYQERLAEDAKKRSSKARSLEMLTEEALIHEYSGLFDEGYYGSFGERYYSPFGYDDHYDPFGYRRY
jgi:hypothetical protein